MCGRPSLRCPGLEGASERVGARARPGRFCRSPRRPAPGTLLRRLASQATHHDCICALIWLLPSANFARPALGLNWHLRGSLLVGFAAATSCHASILMEHLVYVGPGVGSPTNPPARTSGVITRTPGVITSTSPPCHRWVAALPSLLRADRKSPARGVRASRAASACNLAQKGQNLGRVGGVGTGAALRRCSNTLSGSAVGAWDILHVAV